jgi:hypothetical protein
MEFYWNLTVHEIRNQNDIKNAVFCDVAPSRSCVNRSSSETSVHTKSTRRHITEYGILHSHRRENLKPYNTTLNILWRSTSDLQLSVQMLLRRGSYLLLQFEISFCLGANECPCPDTELCKTLS